LKQTRVELIAMGELMTMKIVDRGRPRPGEQYTEK
jgi:hypothetical protein